MGRDDLYITVPSFFRCPISLDVMKSPVSLSTGVTYDRSSIQRWLDSGNNTCPATMQVLHCKDFVPNHTLHRLIQIWSTSAHTRPNTKPDLTSLTQAQAQDLIRRILSGGQDRKFESFIRILCFASESQDNSRVVGSNEEFVDLLIRVVGSDPDPDPVEGGDVVEAGLKILQVVSPKLSVVAVVKKYPDFLKSMARILKRGRSDSRVAVAGLLEAFSPDPDSKKAVFDNEELLFELLQVLSKSNPLPAGEAVAVLSCLVWLASPRANKVKLARAGGVKVLTTLIGGVDNNNNNNNNKNINTTSNNTVITCGIDNNGVRNNVTNNNNSEIVPVTELVLTLLEMLAGSAEGRAAISEDTRCVARIIQKLMKVSPSANEHGIALLWSLCYLFRDQKAKEAVMRSNGGLTKILLLMQSNCSPAVKRMCCDLLRIFRVNSKSCLSSYDTKTTHIMPC